MRIRHLLLVLALGLTTLSPAVAQERRERPATQGTLKLLSYNVHGLPAFITGDDTLARQTAISPLLETFDVVGIQEDFMKPGHERLLKAVTHSNRVRFDQALKDRFYGSGLTLLARPRTVTRRTAHFAIFHGITGNGNDGLASKGFQMVRLELAPGVEVDVYNSHMDAGGAAGDRNARAVQVAHITSAMQRTSAGRAIVFLGDTNLKRGRDRETLTRWLTATGLSCTCAAARTRCCGRIDRILFRSGVGVELRVETWGVAPGFTDRRGRSLSDHDPIRAVLRWRRRPL